MNTYSVVCADRSGEVWTESENLTREAAIREAAEIRAEAPWRAVFVTDDDGRAVDEFDEEDI